ncbi:MAG: MarR family transcriptional regulator [Burkholderiaceae bacterium]|jgi:DNA-binding MarR family transcriptional regulator|nr:MarR family transcriptional regulator [Burkholderiaceae bacterium]MEB2318331.1 MarR family transcriptional regulator [Pseudomonadota bacterium]
MGAPSLGFALADVTRLMRRAFRHRLRGSQLTYTQARVLVHLANESGIRQIDLAERLEMQPMALSRAIDQLARRGVVKRCCDPTDGRAHLLVPTPRAQAHLDAIAKVIASIHLDALRGVSSADAGIALSVIEAMRVNLSSRPTDPEKRQAGGERSR